MNNRSMTKAVQPINQQSVLTNFNLQRPAVLLSNSAYISHWVSQVRGKGPVNVGLQLEKENNTMFKELSYSQINQTL